MNPKAARDAIAHARKLTSSYSIYPVPGREGAILDAVDEVFRYAQAVELRLGQHLNGGSIDHTDLLPMRDQRA